ncbi:MAG: serine/threonine protein kinase [Myxococcales bacterium]|nr:serine/threonine protein kinase [Myxococcales bacterium]
MTAVPCPDANSLQALMAGLLGSQARAPLARHLDGCGECRAVLASLARGDDDGDGIGDSDGDSDDDGVGDSDGDARALALAATISPGRALALDDTVAEAAPAARPAPPALLSPGAKLGRYVISGRLGAGAMGVVYGAVDPELGREVAIKVLRRPDPQLRDRLGREARAMAQVSHPNVVAVYDVGAVGEQVYIAMELVRGQTLRQWQEQAPRSTKELVEIYLAAGRGLAAAHAAGVIHRDFKPDNVLLGVDGRPRVTDFGLAGVAAGAAARASVSLADLGPRPGGPGADELALTRTGVLIGTPVYMAPEQFAGGNIDPRSDQWAFCVSLFEALYGQRPFAGASWDELAQAVAAGVVREPAVRRASPALGRIVRRGLAVRPGDRHATMEELLAELGRDRGTPWRRAAAGCGLIAAVFAAGLGADALLRQRAEDATTQSFRATGRQLERSVALRYESFIALADASYSVPVMHKVLGHKDQADFGLGEQGLDTENLALVHDTLASADWLSWAQRTSRATIAVGDYKGRLLFTSADPARWGADLLALPAASHAFSVGAARAGGAMVARYDDPRLLAAQLYGPTPPAGLAVVFARALVVGGVPLGLFVQAIDGAQLLADVSVGEELELALVAPDGSAVGQVPAKLARAARPGDIREAREAGVVRLVQARPLLGLDGASPIASLVLARRIDPGLAGLFARARTVFALAAALLLAGALGAAWRARALRRI